ncbi:hypothetical protein [Nocardia sp. NPDC003345]
MSPLMVAGLLLFVCLPRSRTRARRPGSAVVSSSMLARCRFGLRRRCK